MASAPQRVLVVDDEQKITDVVGSYLRRAGYAPLTASDGAEALRIFEKERPALVILDLMLPGLDGLGVLQRLRARRDATPVLILTAKEGKDSIVQMLNAGADDYLPKPFDLGELIARAKVLIRRGKGAAHPVLTALGLTVNTLEQTVHRHGLLVDLSPTEYRILEYLIHRPRAVVSKRELLEHLYDFNWEHHSNVIEAHVSNLRKKLDAAAPSAGPHAESGAGPIIETMRGRGYRLAAEPDGAHVRG